MTTDEYMEAFKEFGRVMKAHAPKVEATEKIDGVEVSLYGFDRWADCEPYGDAMGQGRVDVFKGKRAEYAKWFTDTAGALGVLLITSLSESGAEHFAFVKGLGEEWATERPAWAADLVATIKANQNRN